MFRLWEKRVDLDFLNGKTIKEVKGLDEGSDEVLIVTECGQRYEFSHIQDCCEHVRLSDFEGDPSDLVGALIVSAERVSSPNKEGEQPSENVESWTWTFYKIETNKGGLWMRWLGESNGYYSESVDLIWLNKPDTEED